MCSDQLCKSPLPEWITTSGCFQKSSEICNEIRQSHFQNYDQRGYQKHFFQKNTPEMNVSERDSYFTTNVTHNNNYYSDGNIISENLGCSEIFALFFGPKNIGFWTFLKNKFSELWSEGVSKIVFSEKHPGNERFRTRSDSWKKFSFQLQIFAEKS